MCLFIINKCVLTKMIPTSEIMKDKKAKMSASKAVMQGFDKLYEKVPSFEDVFSETSFYVFAVTLVILSLILGILASKYIKLKDYGEEKRSSKKKH